MLHELLAWNADHESFGDLSYWRLASGIEVDFIVGQMSVAIEAKASARITADHLKGLPSLARGSLAGARRVVVCLEPKRRVTEDGIEIVPASVFAAEPVLAVNPPATLGLARRSRTPSGEHVTRWQTLRNETFRVTGTRVGRVRRMCNMRVRLHLHVGPAMARIVRDEGKRISSAAPCAPLLRLQMQPAVNGVQRCGHRQGDGSIAHGPVDSGVVHRGGLRSSCMKIRISAFIALGLSAAGGHGVGASQQHLL